MSIEMQFCNQVSNKLDKYIRHYWYSTGFIKGDTGQQLLPMDHSDLIIRCRGSFNYLIKDEIFEPEKVIFTGFRKTPIKVIQNNYVETFGITFKPWGLYPFINQEMAQFSDHIVNLNSIDINFTQSLEKIVDESAIFENNSKFKLVVKEIEKVLIEQLNLSDNYFKMIDLFECFCDGDWSNIKDFCEKYKIQRKKLERYFKKFIGVTPKEFSKISKFETSARVILKEGDERFINIAIDTGYYDQAHFSKSFKEYTNSTPKEFKKEKPALKAKMKYK